MGKYAFFSRVSAKIVGPVSPKIYGGPTAENVCVVKLEGVNYV